MSLLGERAVRHPDAVALVDTVKGRDRVVTYGELWRRVGAGAGFLRSCGLGRGDTVLVYHPVRIELYELLLAALGLGMRVMMVDLSAGRGFVGRCCERVRPDAYFGSWGAQVLGVVLPGVRGVGLRIGTGAWFPGVRRWRVDGDAVELEEVGDDEAALVTFTSGSTGEPKAAVRSHGFLLAQHGALARAFDFEEGEVDLITLPVFVLANLASGLTSVLADTDLRRPGEPGCEEVRGQCARNGVTRCSASPAFFEGFLGSGGGMFGAEKVFTGGAPVFPDLVARLREALPGAGIFPVYGSTEAEPIAHFDGGLLEGELLEVTAGGGGLCAGEVVEEIEMRVIVDSWGEVLGPLGDREFAGMEVGRGEVGEIVVAGDHVLSGYLGGVGDEETKIRVGERVWHRTGDAGWMDDKERLWLLGRCAQKMRGAERLRYPFAVECALRMRFPGRRFAAVEWRGERVLVCERSGVSGEVLGEFGMDRVVVLDRIPMDRRHQAKVDYGELMRVIKLKF